TALAISLNVLGQMGLGVSMGMIYSASLYFGMVLSDGSTEHGGYHEALIGLGQIIGPGAGAITAWGWAGNTATGIEAVSVVIALTILAAAGAACRAYRLERIIKEERVG